MWASYHGFRGGGWVVRVPFGATAGTSHSALCARRLVEAGGVEFKLKSRNAPVFIGLPVVDPFASADLLTFGTPLKYAILIAVFRTSVLSCAVSSRDSFQPLAKGHRRKQQLLPTRQARKCPPFFSKPRSRSVSTNERNYANNGGRKGPSCA